MKEIRKKYKLLKLKLARNHLHSLFISLNGEKIRLKNGLMRTP